MMIRKAVLTLSMVAALALAAPAQADRGDRRDGYRGQHQHQSYKGGYGRHKHRAVRHAPVRAHKHWHKHRARHRARHYSQRHAYQPYPGHRYYGDCRASGARVSLWVDGLGISYAERSRC